MSPRTTGTSRPGLVALDGDDQWLRLVGSCWKCIPLPCEPCTANSHRETWCVLAVQGTHDFPAYPPMLIVKRVQPMRGRNRESKATGVSVAWLCVLVSENTSWRFAIAFR